MVNVLNSQSQQELVLSYCMAKVYGAEQVFDSAPESEYALQADGTVLVTSGKPPKTKEQRFREGQRMQMELETGGGPVVQDCASSLYWFGTWHNQPGPTKEKVMEILAKAKADLEEIDKMLDARLVEILPKPPVMQRESLSTPPTNPSGPPSQIPAVALNNRGVARQDKGDLDGAIQDYSEAIRLKPDYAIAFLSRGTARRAKGDLDGAVQDFSEAVRLKPNDAKVFVYRGAARLAKLDIDGAIQDFNAAISLKSDYADGFNGRGVARQNKGDIDGAIQDFSQAVRLKPDYAIAFDNRGMTRQLKGDLDGAIQDFTEAIRLKPDYAKAFHDRGATRARKGDAAGAQQDNSRAAQLGWH
jgi:tetratricopeptide (TPR) repeat protein